MPSKHPSRVFEDPEDEPSPSDGTSALPVTPPLSHPALSDRKLLRMLYDEVLALRDTVNLLRYRTRMVERLVYGTATLVLVAFATGLIAMVWHHTP